MEAPPQESGVWEGCLQYAALSDIGMRRMTNQDAYAAVLASDMEAFARRGHLFVVADGMGAHAAGELASRLAVDGIPHYYVKHGQETPPWEALANAFRQTNASVHARGEANLDFHNMGTTASALLLLPGEAYVAHVGDSRVYRLRGDTLEQLTFDHSLVWELQAAGHVPAGGGGAIPKNIITRSLGPNPEVQVDLEGPYALEVGDTFFLCTDGLTGQVDDEEIAEILVHLPPDESARLLVDLANLRGGPDNITVVVVRVIGDALATRSGQPVGDARRTGGRRPVHPWVWIAAATLVLLGLAFLFAGMPLIGLPAWGIALVVLISGWFAAAAQASSPVGGRRFGRGPYRTARADNARRLLTRLDTIARQLFEAAEEHAWDIGEEEFEAAYRQANDAAVAERNGEAFRGYSRLIGRMMNQLRQM